MDQAEFKMWARYIQDISGIFLEPAKSYLIETRFAPLLREYHCRTFSELYQKSMADGTRNIENKIIDQITTNETLFFRDVSPFEILKIKILPALIDQKIQQAFSNAPVPIRIWSAGCSSGQEVYSIAITLKEMLSDSKNYQVTVLGTDISSRAIFRAECGVYSQFEVDRGLTIDQLEKYFVREGDFWKIRKNIRDMVSFKKMNLMQPFMRLGRFDIIFCRNVAIYFAMTDRKKLFENIEKVLALDGSLIIGSTESLTGIAPQFELWPACGSMFYRLRNSPYSLKGITYDRVFQTDTRGG
jgi:chemotaxis protein methyltransferase CheR